MIKGLTVTAAQKRLNEMYRALVDNLTLANSPQMIVHDAALDPAVAAGENMRPGKVWSTAIMDKYNENLVEGSMANIYNKRTTDLIPEASRQHIFQIDHQPDYMNDCIAVRFTFFNGKRKAIRVTDPDLTPVDEEGFEEWQAHVVMMSDAGEDVHPRPKPTAFGAAPGGPSSAAVRSQQSGLMSAAGLGNSNLQSGFAQGLASRGAGYSSALQGAAGSARGLLDGNPRR